MLVDYAVTEMVCFDNYLDAAPHSKKNERKWCYHLSFARRPMYTFQSNKYFTATLIAKAWLKSLYSRLGFKVIKDSTISPNFEKACKKFHYGSVKSKVLQKQKIGLQCYLTIPRCVTIIHDNRIDFNGNKYAFKDLNEVPPSDDWFPYEYIDAEVNNKSEKTKGRIAGDEMEKENKYYVEYLNHGPN